jgi:hypothetical protein
MSEVDLDALLVVSNIPSGSSLLVSVTLCRQRRSIPSSLAARTTASSRLPITLWLTAVTPTRLPARTSSQIIRAPV